MTPACDEGDEISMYYDPMIAKLVAHGRDRAEAIARLQQALDGFVVDGIGNNLVFLNAALANDTFRSGTFSTAFIEEEFAEGYFGPERTDAVVETLVPIIAAAHTIRSLRDACLSGQMPGQSWRPSREWVVRIDRKDYAVDVIPGDNGCTIGWNGASLRVTTDWAPGDRVFQGHVDGRPVTAQVVSTGAGYRVSHNGAAVALEVLTPRQAELAALMPIKEPPDLSKFTMSPMPGLLLRISVEVGEEVQEGQEIAVVEAMKMENILRAERRGVVKSVNAEQGDSMTADQVIVEFE